MEESELEHLELILQTALKPLSTHQLEEQTRFDRDELETRLQYLEQQGRVTRQEQNFQTIWSVEDED